MVDFRIADSFTDSLGRLTADEQKAVKTTAFDLQINRAHPSFQFHKLDKARDRRFFSIRVNRDVRIIVHKSEDSLLLCYVGHHDDAYRWAECRKLETHPRTGAAQLVEIRETVKEIAVPKYVGATRQEPSRAHLFDGVADDVLLGYGVPADWLDDVRNANQDSLLELTEHLPSEAAEALLDLAIGETPQSVKTRTPEPNPFQHPDAQRRFRVISNVEELERALEFPWDKWTIFLHPMQRFLVERAYNGPARVSGSAGTGKTIVALHRAVFLARTNPEARVLLTTFSEALANALRGKLRRLTGSEPRLGERLEVHSMNAIGTRLYELNIGALRLASPEMIQQLLVGAGTSAGSKFSSHFLRTEWEQVVDAWQLESWEAYRDVARLGRKTRLPEPARAALWSIFDSVRTALQSRGLITYSFLFTHLAERISETGRVPFDFAVVDEAQDISVAQLRFLAALGGTRPNALFFAGDLGQRIFQQPFSWSALGVNVRGRSFTLRINYRTSHQIRTKADRLLAPELTDVDGIVEKRTGTTSTFNGPDPEVVIFHTEAEEEQSVSKWLLSRKKEGVAAHEIGIFVRSESELERAQAAATLAEIPFKVLDKNVETTSGYASIGTMHLAKGLEFRTVVVMACDDEIVPLQERIQNIGDDADLDDVYASERHLLYVACTRARDHLFVSGVEPASEFIDDLVASHQAV